MIIQLQRRSRFPLDTKDVSAQWFTEKAVTPRCSQNTFGRSSKVCVIITSHYSVDCVVASWECEHMSNPIHEVKWELHLLWVWIWEKRMRKTNPNPDFYQVPKRGIHARTNSANWSAHWTNILSFFSNLYDSMWGMHRLLRLIMFQRGTCGQTQNHHQELSWSR